MVRISNVKRDLKRVILAAICVGILLTFVQPVNIESVSTITGKTNVATSTYYDYKWWVLFTSRDKITTSLYSTSTSNGTKSTVLKAVNTTSQPQKFGYSYSRSLSGEISLGASVPVKAIELEVGGKVSYSTTTTISTETTVPAKTTHYVYRRQDSNIRKFKNIVQNQLLYTDGSWRNNGSSKTVYSTFTEKYPTIIISK